MAETRTAGRYELQEELGRGAMGIVYKAYDPRIGRAVAVKTMKLTEAGTGMNHEELVARFDIETKAAGRLTHPNIVVVYDAGADGGLFYITMELVHGRSLQALIDQKQVFPLPRVLRIMEQAGSALDFAHQNSVVHRDIKPANLLVTADDTLKVSDFGTAKILQKGATQTGAILGTPSYMSPEQVKGKPVDGRSDIFSLGVILYELVTGEKPFPGQNVTTVIYKIVNEEPIPPRDIDNSVHAGLSYVIMRSLSKDPDERYQTCKDVVDDLKNYKALGGGSESATVVMPGRSRPKEVEEAIARTRATLPATATPMMPPQAERPAAEATPRPFSPRPVTLPPLTGSLPRSVFEEEAPKARSGLWAVLSIVILGIIGAAGYFMWPDIQQMLNPGAPQVSPPSPAELVPAQQPAASPAETQPAPGAPAGESAKTAKEPGKGEPPPAGKALTQDELNAQEIQSRLAAAGLGERVRADVAGRNVTLTGTLTADEARRLRARFQRMPGRMRLVDRLQIAKAAAIPAAGEGESGGGEKPKTAPGMGELEVLTELGGAAVLRGPRGEVKSCKTPCRFEDLPPGRYNLQVGKEGYRTVQKEVNIRAGNIAETAIQLQPVGGGLIVESSPPQADVYINGQHRGVTPVTLPMDAGRYNISVRKQGFQDYTQSVQVGADQLTRMNVPLTRSAGGQSASATQPPAQPSAGKGWIEIRSIPPGADILINNSSTGRSTPARLELAPGTYTVTLFARGYPPYHKQVKVEADKTLLLNEALPRQ